MYSRKLAKHSKLLTLSLRFAAVHITRIQAAISDSVLLAKPSKETLQSQTVASVRRAAIPVQGGKKVIISN